ncbi:hypothetical protein CLOM_g1030 [Closterium sp. NIES-68]|nr:hypothetical protein CLOM_g1030 [Closterium sp. NIES-68]GJP71647.1 hypothetical protein CLOP_g2462 [Closterium sp. NIES-67]
MSSGSGDAGSWRGRGRRGGQEVRGRGRGPPGGRGGYPPEGEGRGQGDRVGGRGRSFGGGGRGGGGRGPPAYEQHPPASQPGYYEPPPAAYAPQGPYAAGPPPPAAPRPAAPPSLPPPSPAPPPPAAASTEAAVAQLTGLSFSRPSGLDAPFPRRPDRGGTVGQIMKIRVNHFPLQIADLEIFHYDVVISPDITIKRINREVIRELSRAYHSSHLGNRLLAFDGVKNAYTAAPLPFESQEFEVSLPDDRPAPAAGEAQPRRPRDRSFKVVLRLAGRASVSQLMEFLAGRQAEVPQEVLQAIDIVLREQPTRMYVPVARSFFSPDLGPRASIGNGVEAWKGFYQSVRPTQMGLTLNLDMAATAFLEAVMLPDFVQRLLNRHSLHQPLSDAERVQLRKGLKGVRIEVTHRGQMRRKYRISGLTTQPLHALTFPLTTPDGQQQVVTVEAYFRQHYSLALQLRNMPCVTTGQGDRINYLPLEVCRIVEGQRHNKKLNEVQTSQILVHAARKPFQRESEINQTVRHNAYDRDPFANEFGIRVSPQMATVNARVLPTPTLKYSDSGGERTVVPQVGAWNMMNKRVLTGAVVRRWSLVNLSRLPRPAAEQFARDLAHMCNITGLQMEQRMCVPMAGGHPAQMEAILRNLARQLTPPQQAMPDVDIVICILNEGNGPLYGNLKRLCETELGIVTQCCLANKLGKGKQYLANVALKINAKVGGRNTALVDSIQRQIPLVCQEHTILFGADVTHPAPGEDNSPSIAAVVASMDWPEMARYRALVSAQAHRLEIIQNLYTCTQDSSGMLQHGGMVRELLISFYRSTGHKPQRVVMYRDGVSDGQFAAVKEYEVAAIKKACASLEESYQPRVTFAVVQKRHHTRFFPFDSRNRSTTDRSGNALPGTVIDTGICHPTEFDFYLLSHSGIQGTSRPTHYHVVHDENGFDSNTLQRMTYSMAYTYARCTRAVSVVPPAYYAHIVAFRARFYMDADQFSDSGSQSTAFEPAPAAVPPSTVTGTSATTGESSGSRSSRSAGEVVVRPLPPLQGRVKEHMFFC